MLVVMPWCELTGARKSQLMNLGRLRQTRSARSVLWGLAISSAVSGLALLCAPRAFGRLFGLPGHDVLRRGPGLRDAALGALMLSPRTRWGLIGRAVSDVVDGVLIVREARLRRRDGTSGRLAVAALSAAAAAALVARQRN